MIIQLNNDEYVYNKMLGSISNLITMDIKPFNEINEIKEKNIFFNADTEEEKELLLNSLIYYFKSKDINWKLKFLEKYLTDSKLFPEKQIKDIFLLINIFDGNFLDINFSIILSSLNNFQIDKLYLNEDMKNKILKLYNDVKNVSNIDDISLEIWPFLILFLVKLNEKEKVIEILSISEKAKIFDSIIRE